MSIQTIDNRTTTPPDPAQLVCGGGRGWLGLWLDVPVSFGLISAYPDIEGGEEWGLPDLYVPSVSVSLRTSLFARRA